MRYLLILCLSFFSSFCYGQDFPSGDITQYLKDRIAAHGSIELPRGDFYITETIKLPGKYGTSIKGEGNAAAHLSAANPYNWRSTRIFWRGPAGTETKAMPMFEANGSRQHFQDITLIGSPTHNTKMIPNVVGILCRKARGLGTGKHHFERVWFQRLRSGIQFGESSTGYGGNCDESYIENCRFQDCFAGTRYESSQALGHTFMHCFYTRVSRAHEIMAGGHITCYKSVMIQPPSGKTSTFFYFTNEAERKYRIGTSAGMITSYNLKVDKQSGSNFRAIAMDSDVNGPTVTFRDAQVSHTAYDKPFMIANGPITIVIDNCRFPAFTDKNYVFGFDNRERFPVIKRIISEKVELDRVLVDPVDPPVVPPTIAPIGIGG